MMAAKAELFGDKEIRDQILKCSDQKQIKALGRKVRGFEQKVWDTFKYAIVLPDFEMQRPKADQGSGPQGAGL